VNATVFSIPPADAACYLRGGTQPGFPGITRIHVTGT
jgi:hypothetical protein